MPQLAEIRPSLFSYCRKTLHLSTWFMGSTCSSREGFVLKSTPWWIFPSSSLADLVQWLRYETFYLTVSLLWYCHSKVQTTGALIPRFSLYTVIPKSKPMLPRTRIVLERGTPHVLNSGTIGVDFYNLQY
ncbi:hypothetical protein U1Q18_000937 [Sarracenia purpurea var. burkii]